MTDVIDIQVRDTGTPVVVRNLQNVADAANNASNALKSVQSILASIGRSTAAGSRIQGLGAAAQTTSGQVQALVGHLNGLNNVNLNNIPRGIGNIGTAATGALNPLSSLENMLRTIAGALAVGKLMDYADAWNSAAGMIRVATNSQAEAAAVTDQVYRAAQRSRMEMGAMTDLYSSIARAGNELGASQSQVIKFTEGVGKALAIQHTSGNQAKGMLIQLGQALAMGKIRAQEWNSMLQNGQVILKTVAKEIEGAEGSVAKLGIMVKSGQVTSKEFFDAFLKGADRLNKDFAETSFLFSQGWTVMKNAVSKYLGEMDQALGISSGFVKIVQWMGDNMPIVAGAIAGVGTAIAVAFAPTVVMQLVGALGVLWAAVLANPFTALAAVLAGVVVALTVMRDEIKLGIDDTTTLGDMMRAVWETVLPIFQMAGAYIGSVFDFITGKSSESKVKLIANGKEVVERKEALWLRLLRTVVQVFDMIGGVVRGVMVGIQAVVGTVLAGIVNHFQQLGNMFKAALDFDGQGIQNAAGKMAGGLAATGKDLGGVFAKAFQAEQLSQADSGLEAYLDKTIKRAQEIGRNRTKTGPAPNLDSPMGVYDPPTPKDKAGDTKARELDRLKEQLAGVIAEINPAQAAMKRLADAQDILDRSVAAGMITQAGAVEIMGKLTKRYADQLDPIGAVTRKLQEQAQTYQYYGDEQQARQQLLQITQDLEKKGVDLTAKQTEELYKQIVAMQELKRQNEAYNQVLNQTVYAKRAQLDQINATGQAKANGAITAGDAAGQAVSIFGQEAMRNSQEYKEMQLQQVADFYAKVDAARQADIISEQTANMLKRQADANYNAQRLQGVSNMFGSLAVLSRSGNSKLAAIGKAAAITQATIDGVLAVQKAYAGSPYPYNIAAAIAQGVIAASNVASIASQTTGFRTGGEFTVGGNGGDDSQLVAFRATPGERVQVNTPTQARALEEGGKGGTYAPPVINVVNVDDPQRYIDAIDTKAGQQVMVNHMESNPAAFRRALGLT